MLYQDQVLCDAIAAKAASFQAYLQLQCMLDCFGACPSASILQGCQTAVCLLCDSLVWPVVACNPFVPLLTIMRLPYFFAGRLVVISCAGFLQDVFRPGDRVLSIITRIMLPGLSRIDLSTSILEATAGQILTDKVGGSHIKLQARSFKCLISFLPLHRLLQQAHFFCAWMCV